jgi:hypothetical protein
VAQSASSGKHPLDVNEFEKMLRSDSTPESEDKIQRPGPPMDINEFSLMLEEGKEDHNKSSGGDDASGVVQEDGDSADKVPAHIVSELAHMDGTSGTSECVDQDGDAKSGERAQKGDGDSDDVRDENLSGDASEMLQIEGVSGGMCQDGEESVSADNAGELVLVSGSSDVDQEEVDLSSEGALQEEDGEVVQEEDEKLGQVDETPTEQGIVGDEEGMTLEEK